MNVNLLIDAIVRRGTRCGGCCARFGRLGPTCALPCDADPQCAGPVDACAPPGSDALFDLCGPSPPGVGGACTVACAGDPHCRAPGLDEALRCDDGRCVPAARPVASPDAGAPPLDPVARQGFETPGRYDPGAPEPVCDPESPQFDPDTPLDVCCPGGRCRGRPQPACSSRLGMAFAGWPYQALAERFGPAGCAPGPDSECTLCSDELPLARVLSSWFSFGPLVTWCLDESVACLVRGDDGALAPCSTPAQRADSANYALRVTTSCARTESEGRGCVQRRAPRMLLPDEWDLDSDAVCAGARLRLRDRPAHGSTLLIEYLRAGR